MSRLTLTPMMETALRTMQRTPLAHYADGWKPMDGSAGCWNSHTLRWLERNRRFCTTTRTVATITEAGRAAIAQADHVEFA